MKLELLKFVVQPVLLERDDAGAIIGERVGQPTACYSAEQLQAFVVAVEAELLAATEQRASDLVVPEPEIVLPHANGRD